MDQTNGELGDLIADIERLAIQEKSSDEVVTAISLSFSCAFNIKLYSPCKTCKNSSEERKKN
jgi:hypothetical protein